MLAGAVALTALWFSLSAGERSGSGGESTHTQDLTFTRDVAPIIFTNCGPCHRPGGSAPFSLLSYQAVEGRAKQIAIVTRTRYMPPWLPEPGHAEFVGARRLGDAQIDTIRRWVDQGRIEGNPSDLPQVPTHKDGWQLGPPDLVLEMPRPYTLPAGGTDVFQNFVFPVAITSRRYVRAMEILPGNKKVLHHASVSIDRSGLARQIEAEDPDVGFSGMGVKFESRSFEPQGHFLSWKPGTPPPVEPQDMAWTLEKGTDLVLNTHMKPSGKPESVQASIGLYFTDTPPTKFPIVLQLEHDGAIDIPPGVKDFLVTDEYPLPLDVDVLGVYPHAHFLGKEVRGIATLPGGEEIPLITIKKWNPDWQGEFRYTKPVHLPKGTVLTMRWTYDNSEGNERNPNVPPKRVRFGNETSDEMSHLWVQLLPREAEGRKTLQEALMLAKLRKYPHDFQANLNLGIVLQSMGRLPEATVQYRKALLIKPGDAAAENSLGAALLSAGTSTGSLEEAIGHFRAALRTRPNYPDASYNLGSALLASGNPEEAIVLFRRILSESPDDADAHDRLGSAYILLGSDREAVSHLEAALRINPMHASAHYSLGFIQARTGDLAQAATHLESALRIRPNDVRAHNALGSVYEKQGRLGEAIAHFEASLRFDPGNDDAREGLERARERHR